MTVSHGARRNFAEVDRAVQIELMLMRMVFLNMLRLLSQLSMSKSASRLAGLQVLR
jgi:hypothetical protein